MNRPFLRQLGLNLNQFDDIGSEYSLFESNFLFAKDLNDLAGESQGLQSIGSEDVLNRINVWVINEIDMVRMIPKIISPQDLEFTFAIIVPDTEQPWDIMSQSEKWIKALQEQIFMISPNMDLKLMEKLRNRTINLFKTYEEPELDADGKIINKKIKLKMDQSQVQDHEDIDMSIVED